MNIPLVFDWDDGKAAKVDAERGIPFATAAAVFLDAMRIDAVDDRQDYGEERRVTIGSVDGRLLSVVYTMRGETCWIVTVWPASRKQRRLYRGQVRS